MLASYIAKAIGGRLLGEDVDLLQAAPLFMAGPFDLSAIIWPKDVGQAKRSRAGAILADVATAASYADEISSPIIAVDDFVHAFLGLRELFRKPYHQKKKIEDGAFIHPKAYIGQAFIGRGSRIGANVVIEDGVVVESDCLIEAGVVINGGVSIGSSCAIKANTVLGSEGFVPYGQNAKNLACLGRVVIESHVRIGALCCIDRGLLGSTTIKRNALIDNMVHIGHDSQVGENAIIAGQSGLAGMVRLGDYVTCGGQVGIAPHVKVGDQARISGKSFVHCDIKSQEIWSGNPSLPHSIYLRSYGRSMRDFRKR